MASRCPGPPQACLLQTSPFPGLPSLVNASLLSLKAEPCLGSGAPPLLVGGSLLSHAVVAQIHLVEF